MNTSKGKLRFWFVVALFSMSLICFTYARPKTTAGQDLTEAQIRQMCRDAGQRTAENCKKNLPANATHAETGRCDDKGDGVEGECLLKNGLSPLATGASGGSGMGQVTPPPRSHPIPTPRKGPDKIGPTGIGRPFATPTPRSTPGFRDKSTRPSPTPRKNHGN